MEGKLTAMRSNEEPPMTLGQRWTPTRRLTGNPSCKDLAGAAPRPLRRAVGLARPATTA